MNNDVKELLELLECILNGTDILLNTLSELKTRKARLLF